MLTLKDIYSDTACQYNEYETNSTCGISWGDCLSRVILNLEPIIRKANEANGYKNNTNYRFCEQSVRFDFSLGIILGNDKHSRKYLENNI